MGLIKKKKKRNKENGVAGRSVGPARPPARPPSRGHPYKVVYRELTAPKIVNDEVRAGCPKLKHTTHGQLTWPLSPPP